MTKIKLDLKNKTVSAKLNEATVIAPQLLADANPQIVAIGNALTAMNDELQQKDTFRAQKQDEMMEATGLLNETERKWDNLMRAAAAKVVEIYPENPAKWLGMGFQPSIRKNSTGVPEQVNALGVTFGEGSGIANLNWDKLPNAKSYKIQINEADPMNENDWKFATPDLTTKCKATVVNLTAGKRVWFRVAGFNASGQGIWSSPVNRVIP